MISTVKQFVKRNVINFLEHHINHVTQCNRIDFTCFVWMIQNATGWDVMLLDETESEGMHYASMQWDTTECDRMRRDATRLDEMRQDAKV